MDNAIHINLKLFATLASKTPNNAESFPLQAGTTVAQVLAKLNIAPEKAKLIFVNGLKQSYDYRLQDGDRLGIFPPVGGG